MRSTLLSATAIHSLVQDNDNDHLPAPYNPYPHGILPSNLNSEIARVQREIRFIESEAIGEWHALPPAMRRSSQCHPYHPARMPYVTLRRPHCQAPEFLNRWPRFLPANVAGRR
jgi:hypothetical protein